jgi:hypothetical protein
MKNSILCPLLIAILSISIPLSSAQAAESKCPLLFKKEKLCAELHWVKEPKAVEMPTEKDKAEFTLTFKSTTGKKENTDPKQRVSVGIFMPSMDHGSMPVTLTKTETGVYQVQNVYFTMSGEWEIHVKLVATESKTEKIVDQAKVPYTLK